MNNLYVYGDSFAYSSPDGNIPSWSSILSKQLNLKEYNRSIYGGSTENAILKFYNDYIENRFSKDDVIIFVESTPGRLHLEYQKKNPDTASLFLHEVDERSDHYRYYNDNKNYIRWYIGNYDNNLFELNHEAYFHMLRNFAENNKDITFIFLTNSGHYPSIQMKDIPDNFFKPDIKLLNVSQREVILDSYDNWWSDWCRHTKYDLREGHLSNINLKILADLIEDIVVRRTIERFSYDAFQTKIMKPIECLDDYIQYVDKGYLYDTRWKRQYLRK